MNFDVGEVLVYPHHGAVTITKIQTRTIKGVEKKYVTLNAHMSDLTIEIPVESAELVGMRDVIDESGIDAVFDVLRSDYVDEAGNWSRRYKAKQEKMASGSVLRVSEVVRDLWRRDRDKGVSAAEKNMLVKSRQVLISELALARHVSNDEATVLLDEVLATLAE